VIKSFSMTDIGKLRKINQDYVFSSDLPLGNLENLYIVADGMGGHKAGDYASKYSVETVVSRVVMNKSNNVIEILTEAVEAANEYIRTKSMEDSNLVGMGTTMVVASTQDDVLYVGNVGDSRLYVVEDGKIRQVTRDHSLVEEMVRLGGIDRKAVRNHPDKNIITRAIGASVSVNVDFFEVELKDDMVFLICSDGLTNMVEDEVIEQVINVYKDDLGKCAQSLIQAANANGGRDNIAVVLGKHTQDK